MKTNIIVAFSQVHAETLAKSIGLTGWQWRLATDVSVIRPLSPITHNLIFCETARRLPEYHDIVNCADAYGWNVPAPLHEWGNHSATLSGAFKLLEGVHGTDGYTVFSKQADIGVYLDGVLVMHRREDGMLRIAKKGEGLS